MKKTFCDVCGREMTDEISGRSIGTSYGRVSVNIVASVVAPEPEEGGDLCKYCVITAISSLDDRPKVTAVAAENDPKGE